MTQMMAVSLGRLSVGKALDGLDIEDPEPSVRPAAVPIDRFHGPFGVLFMPLGTSAGFSSSDNGQKLGLEAGDVAAPAPNGTPELTPTLLRYFKSHVVSFSYAARRETDLCPWQNIHVPAAEEAYEKLLLHSVPAPTSLSLLNSLLASSCFHLAPRDTASTDKWAELGEQYKHEARQHLDIAIQEEVLSLTETNYEELLMALLSMTMLEVCCPPHFLVCAHPLKRLFAPLQILCAKYNEAEYLLLEAEYLIRTRGLPKSHKPLKLRSLHHVYTYLRILTESTCGCILRNICPARPGSRSRLVTEESRHKLRSFRVADQSTEADLRMDVRKNAPAAQDDVHLEEMGDWPESLFPELYGLPESLLGLLSQTIRLSNEQELLHRDTNVDVSMITNLCRRTKALEHNLLSWKLPCEPHSDHSADNHHPATGSGGGFIPRLTTAFHQAVLLFYYRRVQNINGLMLQHVVRKVLDNLQAADGPHEAALLLWPVFLAACEAIEPPLREGLGDWLMNMGEKVGIPAFSTVAELARQVWVLREEKQDYTLSWFDVTSLGRCPIVAL